MALAATGCGEPAGESDDAPAGSGVSVFANDAGNLTTSATAEQSGNHPWVSDLDGNGTAEIVLAGGPPTLLRLAANQLAVYSEIAGLSAQTVSASNVIGGSTPELVVLHDGDVALFSLDAEGKPDSDMRTDVPGDACWMGLADLDRDGDQDILTAGATVQALIGAPDGLEAPLVATELVGGCSPQKIAVADLNDDGLPDVTYGTQQTLYLLVNNRGAWSQDERDVGFAIDAIIPGDFDGDGDDDLLISDGSRLHLWSHVQGLVFEETHVHDLPHDLVHVFDLQRDGTFELLTTEGDMLVAFTDLHTDAPQRVVELSVAGAAMATGLASGDIDGDGDIDVVMTSE